MTKLKQSQQFGPLQLRIMKLLWQGRKNARQITDLLNSSRKEGLVAHSTVQTLLRQLELKGAVSHEVQDRTFVFYALTEERKTVQSAVQDFLSRIFSGNPAELMAHLLKSEKISPNELRNLERLIQEKRKNN